MQTNSVLSLMENPLSETFHPTPQADPDPSIPTLRVPNRPNYGLSSIFAPSISLYALRIKHSIEHIHTEIPEDYMVRVQRNSSLWYILYFYSQIPT
jgi:hypothetical protein